jgi:hypothetical protein
MKPNIVLLLTDDQDERSLGLVPGVEEAIVTAGGTGSGATFDRAFASTGRTSPPSSTRRTPTTSPTSRRPGAVLGRLGRGRPAVRE